MSPRAPSREPTPVGGQAPEAWDGSERRVAKRRRRLRYRFIDRRLGWDRRTRYPVLGAFRDHDWPFVLVLLAINVLSFADGWYTAAELGLGIAREGNPVLAALSARSPDAAIALKLGSVLVATLILWLGRKRQFFIVLGLLILALFAVLVVYHVTTLQSLGWL